MGNGPVEHFVREIARQRQPIAALERVAGVIAGTHTVPSEEGTATSTIFDDAFPVLFRAGYRVAFRLLGDREDASDVAQEACSRACLRWDRLCRRGDPVHWVVRVSSNLAIDRWRRRRVAAAYKPRPPTSPDIPDRVDLHRALKALPRRQREVIVLRYVADLPERAVGAALGLAVGTVKSHTARGLAALRAALSDDEEVV